MPTIESTHILAVAPTGSSAPDSVTIGPNGSIWIEYGNGADSTGLFGKSTIVEYSTQGQIESSYTITGLADGLKYDPQTGDIWALLNNDGNASLRIIDPTTGQVSDDMKYGSGYVYGPDSGRGFDDVVFDGQKVFLSETNPVNPGDPVIVQLQSGTAPFGTLETTNVLSFGDTGTNMVTGQTNQTLPVTDPDSLKMLPNGDLLLTGEADGAYIFVKDPGTAQQAASFLKLPVGFVGDDAIMPTSTSGTFYISNQGANDVIRLTMSGLNTNDLYADITSKNELVQIDPTTGKVTTVLSGLNSPHGLDFVSSGSNTAATTASQSTKPTATPSQASFDTAVERQLQSDVVASLTGAGTTKPVIESTHILAVAPTGSSAPDSVTIEPNGSIWIEYGNGADSTGLFGKSTIVEYGTQGQVESSYTITGLADGLKYDPQTGDIWALLNNDGNASLRIIDPTTGQVSGDMKYGSGYVYGPDSGRGFDDVVFDGQKVFLSETNPVNPGDPVIVQLQNGTAPFGTLETTDVLSFGDTGTNMVTGQTNQTLPVTDPDSLKLLPNGALLLTGEADGAYIFVKDPGTAQQTASFLKLPAGFVGDDAIMPTSTSGTFYISNQGANDVIRLTMSGLNTNDLYADITSKNELVQIDPTTGKVTTVLSGLNSPHGLDFVPDASTSATTHSIQDVLNAAMVQAKPELAAAFTSLLNQTLGAPSAVEQGALAGSSAATLDTVALQQQLLPLLHPTSG